MYEILLNPKGTPFAVEAKELFLQKTIREETKSPEDLMVKQILKRSSCP